MKTGNGALRLGKAWRRSHPLREAAVGMMMRGEASPAEIRQVLLISRQLIRYWCIRAGIAGKTKDARKVYLLRRLLKDLPTPETAEPEHVEIRALRERLKRPRPDRAQLKAAKDRKAADAAEREMPGLPSPSGDLPSA